MKAFLIPRDRPNQRQCFSKIFPSSLALTLQIHFYLHFSRIILECPLALNSATFSAPKSAPKTTLKTTSFMLFLKNVAKNLEKKLVIKWNRSILLIFIFSASYIFRCWGKLPGHAWLEKNCVYEARLLFFSLKKVRLFVFV